jgi:Domain of unknown function (DUF1737)
MEYKIITSYFNIQELENRVNEYIKLGYKPQGGVSCIQTPGSITYLQAVIK